MPLCALCSRLHTCQAAIARQHGGCRLLCIKAPGFALLHKQSEDSAAAVTLKAVPVGDLQWAVEWRVRTVHC